MKYPLLKSLLSLGTIVLACSCSDDKPSSSSDDGVPEQQSTITSCDNAWLLSGDRIYLGYSDLTVTDEAGVQIGFITAIPNSSNVNIVDLSGNLLISNVNLLATTVIFGDNVRFKTIDNVFHLKDATGNYLIYASSIVTDPDGKQIGIANFTTGIITDFNGTVLTQANIMSLPILQPNSRCVDYISPIASSSSADVPPVYSSSSSNNITNSSSSYVPPTPKSSSSSTPKSSSSQPKSSSSAPKSSSSSVVTGQCPNIKVKSGGKSGSGWATRYWDCCKPHCSWPEHAHGNYSKQCTNKGQSENTNWGDGSICSGGPQMTCTSQIPFTIDGCTEMGFAFAAVPASDGGSCGKCYQLTFTGKGKYSTDANHRAIKDKKLIIMTTNIGGDVQQGQFDIMIPGGGVGMFNGCSSMGWGPQGEQYGGLLSDCEKAKNYNASATLSCLKSKCAEVFSSDAKAKQGCLFLAEFMHGAGNPMHDYVEVECPQVLKDKY